MRPRWPTRTAICLDCRTALPEGVPCPAGHTRLSSPRDPAGREQLLTEVWGSKPLRQRMRELAGAGATSSGGGGLLDGCAGCELPGADLGELVVVLAVLFVAGALVWLLVTGVASLIRRWRHRLEPVGAAAGSPACRHATGRTGTVMAWGLLCDDPVTGGPAVGFAAALEHRSRWWRPAGTMLRDGATTGFEVALDGGGRVRVPPGALVVDLSRTPAVRVDRLRLPLWLGELDPARERADDLDPFPCSRVRAIALQPGDRVELLCPLDPTPDPQAEPRSYREPAGALLVPRGVPVLRPL